MERIARELLAVAREMEAEEDAGRWLTASEVREMCPGCADKMARLGISRIRMSRLLESAQTWEQCISQAKKNKKVRDPEALCGWLKQHGPNASERTATDFPSQKALDKYLSEHPDAERGKHKVVKQEEGWGKDMENHPFNLMRKRKNEEAMKEIGKHYKKDPKDLTVDEMSEYNQKKGK